MIPLVLSFLLYSAALGLMLGGILMNHLNPDYGSALTVPIFNAIAIVLALLGLALGAVAYRKDRERIATRRGLRFGFACAVLLVVLFPFANSGALSVVQ